MHLIHKGYCFKKSNKSSQARRCLPKYVQSADLYISCLLTAKLLQVGLFFTLRFLLKFMSIWNMQHIDCLLLEFFFNFPKIHSFNKNSDVSDAYISFLKSKQSHFRSTQLSKLQFAVCDFEIAPSISSSVGIGKLLSTFS